TDNGTTPIPFLPPEEYFLSPTIEPEIQEDKAEEEKGCNKPYEWAQVDPEGNVYPCCQISRRYSVGNLNDLTFEEIWDSEKFTEFREGLTNGNPNRWCAVCNVYNGKRF
ncbi:MAG: SPASM domain-containing protein, partial [Nitrospina sp.]|nr:SPASM domain-containing protein [Nitrospina sp.]